MSKSKVLFLMTGSIACYKACQVISRLVQNNCEVQVVASAAALQFVGNATFEGLTGKSVLTDLYAPGAVMDHIHLMRWADLILVAPATANFINKSASGLADDLISTLFLAHDFKKPFLVAPAMNTSMYLHPTTQGSLQKLTAMGIELLDTAAGILACGEEGYGRLLEPDQILKRTLELLHPRHGQDSQALDESRSKASSNESIKTWSMGEKSTEHRAAATPLRLLVTAGGTQEPIDSVRVISNISSGRTGALIAEAFAELGAEVTLLSAQGSIKAQVPGIKQVSFTSFASLQKELQIQLSENSFTHVIHAAAVSDYSIAAIEILGAQHPPQEALKLKSDAPEISLHLKRNPKLVDHLKSYSKNPGIQVVAFKLTSGASAAERQRAVAKLAASSQADFIVQNDLTEIDTSVHKHHFQLFAHPSSANSSTVACGNINQLIAALSAHLWTEGKI